jgi:alkylation response protein AidB-like acyl-CoA dehydrogenase
MQETLGIGQEATEGEEPSRVHELAAEFDRYLGDPFAEDGPFSYAAIVENEELGRLPAGAVKALRAWGFAETLIPRGFGGRMDNLELTFLLTRQLSRRNVTAAVMFGSSLLGSMPTWLFGTAEQRGLLARGIAAGDLACFAMSERDHGSDLQATAVTATPADGSYRLDGEKWLVGNATRGRFVTVVARDGSGGQDLTLLLADKTALPADSWSNAPAVRTAGLLGHDLSGITFHDAPLPPGSVVGRRGAGLGEILKILQITRTAIGALSIGSADAALALGLRYARERVLYGQEILRIPVIREHLVTAQVDLMLCEATALPVARSLSVCPDRLSLWSAVVKYLVPVIVEDIFAEVGRVLGARSYLREGFASGVFQKLQRDHAIASIFEGTTHVNLFGIGAQLPRVAARAEEVGAEAAAEALLGQLFDWTGEVPVWRPSGADLQITNAGRDEITSCWTPAAERAVELARKELDPRSAEVLTGLLGRLTGFRSDLHARAATAPDPQSVSSMHDAQAHCLLHAAASCLHAWLHGREHASGAFADGAWLILCLQRVLQRLGRGGELDGPAADWLEAEMLAQLDAHRTFSLIELARRPARG